FVGAINDDRVAVGYARDASGDRQAFRTDHGRMVRLPALAGYDRGSAALAINDAGDICGWSQVEGSNEPTLWLPRHPSRLRPGPGPAVHPFGRCFVPASTPGPAAGSAFAPTFGPARLLGFRNGEVLDLSLPAPSLTFNVATTMNRHGVIAAWASGVNPGTLVFS